MILHIINKSPFTHSCFNECLAVCTDGASILFIEDGVLAVNAIDNHQQQSLSARDITLYVLEADIKARGLSLGAAFKPVNDEGFVDLTASHHSSQSWF
ncbi:MAG: tRNA 2-thiouridine synthesizing protein B [Pseudohongiellaceae bacterium]|jgi:tRNA 2-thiouridine synthesizing protein B